MKLRTTLLFYCRIFRILTHFYTLRNKKLSQRLNMAPYAQYLCVASSHWYIQAWLWHIGNWGGKMSWFAGQSPQNRKIWLIMNMTKKIFLQIYVFRLLRKHSWFAGQRPLNRKIWLIMNMITKYLCKFMFFVWFQKTLILKKGIFSSFGKIFLGLNTIMPVNTLIIWLSIVSVLLPNSIRF